MLEFTMAIDCVFSMGHTLYRDGFGASWNLSCISLKDCISCCCENRDTLYESLHYFFKL